MPLALTNGGLFQPMNFAIWTMDGCFNNLRQLDKESVPNNTEDNPPNCSSMVGQLTRDVNELSIQHSPTRDLGDNATAKDFVNVFISDDYLDEVI